MVVRFITCNHLYYNDITKRCSLFPYPFRPTDICHILNLLNISKMAESTVVYTPEQNGMGSVPAWLAMNNGGFGNGLGGWGGGILGFFLGLLFGNGGFGGFGNGFGGGAGAGFLSNQLNNDSGRELLMNAINSNGEASRAAVQNLATALGQDFNLVNSAVQTLQSGLSNLALQQAVSVPQIINAIQSGDCALQSQLAQCCCENRLLTTQQGYESRIATIEQTNQLGSQADRNANSIVGAINAQTVAMNEQFCAVKERELQSKIDTQSDIITQLRGQIDNANQTAAITGYINALVSPIAKEVDDIKCKMPNTVPVTWPNLAAVNTTPYVSGGYYQGGFNGFYAPGANGFNF